MSQPLSRDEHLELLKQAGCHGELDAWQLLWDLLNDREAWTFQPPAPYPAWCFGLLGACTIGIYATAEGFTIYEHEADRETCLETLEQVREWLDANEPEPALTPLQEELLETLHEASLREWAAENGDDKA